MKTPYCHLRKSTETLREMCPYSEFFWSVFSHIRTECGKIFRIYPYLVRMRENTDQKNSEYGHSSCSENRSDSNVEHMLAEKDSVRFFNKSRYFNNFKNRSGFWKLSAGAF